MLAGFSNRGKYTCAFHPKLGWSDTCYKISVTLASFNSQLFESSLKVLCLVPGQGDLGRCPTRKLPKLPGYTGDQGKQCSPNCS